jgi:hypothetical protein
MKPALAVYDVMRRMTCPLITVNTGEADPLTCTVPCFDVSYCGVVCCIVVWCVVPCFDVSCCVLCCVVLVCFVRVGVCVPLCVSSDVRLCLYHCV